MNRSGLCILIPALLLGGSGCTMPTGRPLDGDTAELRRMLMETRRDLDEIRRDQDRLRDQIEYLQYSQGTPPGSSQGAAAGGWPTDLSFTPLAHFSFAEGRPWGSHSLHTSGIWGFLRFPLYHPKTFRLFVGANLALGVLIGWFFADRGFRLPARRWALVLTSVALLPLLVATCMIAAPVALVTTAMRRGRPRTSARSPRWSATPTPLGAAQSCGSETSSSPRRPRRPNATRPSSGWPIWKDMAAGCCAKARPRMAFRATKSSRSAACGRPTRQPWSS